MLDKWTGRFAGLVFAAAFAVASGAVAATEVVVPSDHSDSAVTINNVRSDGQVVTGRVVNNTNAELHDVRLIVSKDFRWRREFRPGDDNPGESEVFTLRETIPPRGSEDFTVSFPTPEPARADGDYETSVKLVGFTQLQYYGSAR
jgi:hypothetical protein